MKIPQTLADMLDNNALKFPDHTAFVFGKQRVTHAEFRSRAARLASAWQRLGLKRQDRVGILSQNRMEFQEVYGSCEMAGFITATVNWRLAIPEMVYIINDGGAKVLVFEAAYAETVAAMKDQLTSVEHYVCIGGDAEGASAYEDVLAGGDSEGAPFRPKPDDIAYLIYTSGTTGRPKGVMLTHAGQCAAAEILGSDQRMCADDRILIMMPLFHIGAKVIQLSQHWRAGTVVLLPSFDPEAILDAIEDEKITVTHMAPTMIQMLLESPRAGATDTSSLRMIVYAAAPMPLPVLKHGLKVFGPVFQQQFGQTEGLGTTLLAHQHKPNGNARDLEILTSVGQASPRVGLRIVDDAGKDLPTGEVGEILLTSPGVMKGYWNNTAATIDTLRDGWVHTGDVGKVDHEGFLYLVDRKKDMIISGGENIYSREVEEAVILHDQVSEVAVIGVRDAKWGEAVMAIVVLKPGAKVSAEDLIEHCKTQIASYKKPRHITFVDEIVKLPSGKIDKVRLRQLYGQI
ncbi:acyl-CoA synthetase (AMP-forming)/AMP-acid ligase II [Hoeflea sp. IMCC20628]|uniref:long-chain-fatty-acid--CoA ligase n=1 Tax=Hoeflea sp. IMCC20628 TaxID=1620421 RepID=UPI00063AA803|nr:long-chain-fatty-acid--CoA ligase [Hoeflea sp. IMCC20628]AKH98853.1 acyl-CoA synthetase (AMP-forming)/AMP-acid ligase II [Hoeflea sp. IMCC20628]